jgi:hypothetical protein
MRRNWSTQASFVPAAAELRVRGSLPSIGARYQPAADNPFCASGQAVDEMVCATASGHPCWGYASVLSDTDRSATRRVARDWIGQVFPRLSLILHVTDTIRRKA